jgi:predicted RNase H-like HicB family nuclease
MPQLTLEYWEDDGWFVGRLVEVPGIFSQGETVEELKENIQDAYKLMLESEPMDAVPTPRNRIPLEVRA